MLKTIMMSTAFIGWGLGILLIILSNASWLIAKTGYKRIGWKKHRTGYSIKEIKKAIEITDDETINRKLKNKIIYRKVGYLLIISTPILIIANEILNRIIS